MKNIFTLLIVCLGLFSVNQAFAQCEVPSTVNTTAPDCTAQNTGVSCGTMTVLSVPPTTFGDLTSSPTTNSAGDAGLVIVGPNDGGTGLGQNAGCYTFCFDWVQGAGTNSANLYFGTSTFEDNNLDGDLPMTNDCDAGIFDVAVYDDLGNLISTSSAISGLTAGDTYTACMSVTLFNYDPGTDNTYDSNGSAVLVGDDGSTTTSGDPSIADGTCSLESVAMGVENFMSACEASGFDIADGFACSEADFTLDYTGTPITETSFMSDFTGDGVADFACAGFVAFAETDAASMLIETGSGDGISSGSAATIADWNGAGGGSMPNIVGFDNGAAAYDCSDTAGTGMDFNFTNNTCAPITIDVVIVPIFAVFDGNPGNAFLGWTGVTADCVPLAEMATITIYPNVEAVVTIPADCAGAVPTAVLRVVGAVPPVICDTQTGMVGMDMPVGCANAADANGLLNYDFSANVVGWPAACVTTAMTGSTTSTCQCVPVELLYVEAEEQGATNVLRWATASEFDNSHFELERSADGQKFEPIGKIDGAGTTVEEQRYQLVDTNPLSVGYYRLKQVDFSGTFDYSDVVVVNRKDTGKGIVDVYPVPTSEDLTVQYEVNQSRDVVFTLTDVLGRVINRQVVGANEGLNYHTVDMINTANGLYFLTYSDGNTEQTRRVLKN